MEEPVSTPPAPATSSVASAGALHVVVQRCKHAKLLIDADRDTWTEIGQGLVLYVSFAAPEAGAEAGADPARRLRQAARSILTAPLSTADQWQANHSDAQSVVALCLRGTAQGLLVVPQASLVCKLEPGDKNVKYHQQCSKEDARALYLGLVEALRAAAEELIAVPLPRHDAARWEALQSQRAAAALISPEAFFRVGEYEGKFSSYDERGVPTHDADGVEVTKSAAKKLEKIYAAQLKKHAKAAEASEPTRDEGPPNGEAGARAAATEPRELPEGACLPDIRHGTFGGRQGFEMVSSGPFTHTFVF